MNGAETRAELIDPKLRACGWGVVEGSKVLREYHCHRPEDRRHRLEDHRHRPEDHVIDRKIAVIDVKAFPDVKYFQFSLIIYY